MSKYLQHLRTRVKSIIPHSRKKLLDDAYDIKDEIGTGNYAVVKKATDKRTGDSVAIKIYDKLKLTHTQKEWIKTEVEILKLYRHPNIISFKECFDTSKSFYLVTELMTGGELFDLIRKKKYLNEIEASKIMAQILSAVCFLHKNGVMHTDIKADNILMNIENEEIVIKLADFGFAQKIGNGTASTSCGTFFYSAPEIIKRQNYDKTADMWSVGVLLYILLCGFPPFYDEDQDKLIDILSNPVLEFPAGSWRHVSAEAKDLVTRMLRVDAAQRISAADALLHPWFLKHAEATTTTDNTRPSSSSTPSSSKRNNSVHSRSSDSHSGKKYSTQSESHSTSSEEEGYSFCVHDGDQYNPSSSASSSS